MSARTTEVELQHDDDYWWGQSIVGQTGLSGMSGLVGSGGPRLVSAVMVSANEIDLTFSESTLFPGTAKNTDLTISVNGTTTWQQSDFTLAAPPTMLLKFTLTGPPPSVASGDAVLVSFVSGVFATAAGAIPIPGVRNFNVSNNVLGFFMRAYSVGSSGRDSMAGSSGIGEVNMVILKREIADPKYSGLPNDGGCG